MIGKACLLVILTSLSITPCLAQAAVGGPKKSQNYIGGPVAPKNPVVPPRPGEAVRTGPSTQKPLATVGGPKNIGAPMAPKNAVVPPRPKGR
jgi:hypothetical protein